MSRSQVGIVLFGGTDASGGDPLHLFLVRTCVAFSLATVLMVVNPRSVEIQAGKEMSPLPQKIGDMARWISSIWPAVRY